MVSKKELRKLFNLWISLLRSRKNVCLGRVWAGIIPILQSAERYVQCFSIISQCICCKTQFTDGIKVCSALICQKLRLMPFVKLWNPWSCQSILKNWVGKVYPFSTYQILIMLFKNTFLCTTIIFMISTELGAIRWNMKNYDFETFVMTFEMKWYEKKFFGSRYWIITFLFLNHKSI